MTIGIKYVGGAVQTNVSGAMTPSVPGAGGTFTVADATGYPPSGNFEVKINRGLSDEEHIKITSRSGTVFTVNTRGYDGTSAQSHADGATCELYFSALSAQALVDHVDDVESDPHAATLLNNTRHDVPARHTFGAALPTPATPTAIVPDAAGSAGAAAGPARADHTHASPAAAPVAVGTALAEGAGADWARATHVHTIGTGAINASTMFASGVVNSAAIGAGAIDDHSKFSTDTQPFIVEAVDPGAVGANRIWFDTSNRIIKVRNATNTAWGSYAFDMLDEVHSDSNLFNNVTLGTGGVPSAYRTYTRIGDFVYVAGGFVLGTSGNVTGEITLDLPFTARTLPSPSGQLFAGGARCLDASVSTVYSGTSQIDMAGTVVRNAVLTGASAAWDANTPFDWSSGDRCWLFAGYWKA